MDADRVSCLSILHTNRVILLCVALAGIENCML